MMADVLRRWLQSQAIVKPVIYITICSVLINVRGVYPPLSLTHTTRRGTHGTHTYTHT